jgi:hypothetical protein
MLLAIKRLCVPVHRVGRSESVHSAMEEHVITGPIVDVMLRMKGAAAAPAASTGTGCVIGCTCLGVQARNPTRISSKNVTLSALRETQRWLRCGSTVWWWTKRRRCFSRSIFQPLRGGFDFQAGCRASHSLRPVPQVTI